MNEAAEVVVLPSDANMTKLHGYIRLKDRDLCLSFTCREPGGRVIIESLNGNAALQQSWTHVTDAAKRRLAGCPSAGAFVNELVDVLSDQARASAVAKEPTEMMPRYFAQLLHELETLGWGHVEELSEDGSSVTLGVTDAHSRRHKVHVELTDGYEIRGPPRCSGDLPSPFEIRGQLPRVGWSQLVLKHFREAVERFQDVWEVLDDIDAHCWVLGSDSKTRASTIRRIVIDRCASVVVEVDHHTPRNVCGITFVGADATTRPLQEKLYNNLSRWNASHLVRANLEEVLEVNLPPQPSHVSQEQECGATARDTSADCAVCYAYELDTSAGPAVPSCICANPRCGRYFHPDCLRGWLQSLPDTKSSFGVLMGRCPYCREGISVAADA